MQVDLAAQVRIKLLLLKAVCLIYGHSYCMHRAQNKNSNLIAHVQKMSPCILSLHSKCAVNVAYQIGYTAKLLGDWPTYCFILCCVHVYMHNVHACTVIFASFMSHIGTQ